MVEIEDAVIVGRQFKAAGLAFPAQLFNVLDLSLFPSVYAEPVEALFAQAHDSVLVAGLCIKRRNRFLLMAGRTYFRFHSATIPA